MTETWIIRMCQGICRRRIAVCAIVFAAMLLFAGANNRYITNFMNGPYSMSEADLGQLTNPELSPRYFVRVSGTKTVDTGLREIDIKASYIALEVGDKQLIVKRDQVLRRSSKEDLPRFLPNSNRIFSTNRKCG